MATYDGTEDGDNYSGTSGNDIIKGHGGNDTLSGQGGDDLIEGGDGNDYINGGAGIDSLDGGAGDDTLIIDLAADAVAGEHYIGGIGYDTLYVFSPDYVMTDLTTATIDADIELLDSWTRSRVTLDQFNRFSSVSGAIQLANAGTIDLATRFVSGILFLADGENHVSLVGQVSANSVTVNGGTGNDTVIGSEHLDVLSGGDGNDVLEGRGGDDYLEGGAGDDVMRGGDGNDSIFGGFGADTIEGNDGNDIVKLDFYNGVFATTLLSGGSGTDTLNVTISPYGDVILDFSKLGFAGDFEILNAEFAHAMISVESLAQFQSVLVKSIQLTTGGSVTQTDAMKARTFILSDFGNTVDTSQGSAGWVTGGAGDDTIIGNSIGQTLTGGSGNDVIHGNGGADEITGGAGADLIDGGSGDDIFHVQDGETLPGGEHYIGGSGSDTLFIDGPTYGYVDVVADITAATIDHDVEKLAGANLSGVRATRAQISAFSAVSVHSVHIADGGALDLTGQTYLGVLYLSDAGNQVTLSSTGTYYEVDGGSGADTIDGSAVQSAMTIHGGGGDDLIRSGAGDDALSGGSGDDIIYGGAGRDLFVDDAGNDTYYGEDGDDYFVVSGLTAGNDRFYGGAGYDFIEISDAFGPVDLSSLVLGADIERIAGTDLHLTGAQASHFTTIETGTLTLTTAGTVILHNGGFNGWTINLSAEGNGVDLSGTERGYTINGGASGDTIISGNGINFLSGGGGADTIFGGTGVDFIDGGTGADQMLGGLGNDSYTVDNQADLIFENADEGYDTVHSVGAGYYLYANIEALTLEPQAGNGFGVGNALDNIITGNAGSNLLLGGLGADNISGGGGNDSLFGEDGVDFLYGGAGVDYLVGGAGNDAIDGGDDPDAIYGGDGDDVLNGGYGFHTDILVGGDGNDVLIGSSSDLGDYDLMDGGNGDDTYYADTSADLTFEAVGGGNDTVIAEAGGGYYLYANVENLVLAGTVAYGVGNELDNHLTGNGLVNLLLGGAGNDVIDGGAGNDVLYGQAGADRFVFQHGTGGDVIADFQTGTDKIDLSGLGFSSYANVQAHMVENAGTTAIDLGGGDFVVILGIANSAFGQVDFII